MVGFINPQAVYGNNGYSGAAQVPYGYQLPYGYGGGYPPMGGMGYPQMGGMGMGMYPFSVGGSGSFTPQQMPQLPAFPNFGGGNISMTTGEKGAGAAEMAGAAKTMSENQKLAYEKLVTNWKTQAGEVDTTNRWMLAGSVFQGVLNTACSWFLQDQANDINSRMVELQYGENGLMAKELQLREKLGQMAVTMNEDNGDLQRDLAEIMANVEIRKTEIAADKSVKNTETVAKYGYLNSQFQGHYNYGRPTVPTRTYMG